MRNMDKVYEQRMLRLNHEKAYYIALEKILERQKNGFSGDESGLTKDENEAFRIYVNNRVEYKTGRSK